MLPGESRDAGLIADLVQSCAAILEFTHNASKADFLEDARLISAVSFQVAILGEAVKGVSDSLRIRYPAIPWKKIAGMRDRLIHGYHDIDVDELWNTAVRDIPTLREQLKNIQTEMGF
jgi:uncharacterized protein with HEPN domain